MNAPVEQRLHDAAVALSLTPAVISAARAHAILEKRSVPEVLQESLSLAPDVLARVLGRTLHFEVLDMSGLTGLTPAFDLLSFAEATLHGCLAFRATGSVCSS